MLSVAQWKLLVFSAGRSNTPDVVRGGKEESMGWRGRTEDKNKEWREEEMGNKKSEEGGTEGKDKE